METKIDIEILEKELAELMIRKDPNTLDDVRSKLNDLTSYMSGQITKLRSKESVDMDLTKSDRLKTIIRDYSDYWPTIGHRAAVVRAYFTVLANHDKWEKSKDRRNIVIIVPQETVITVFVYDQFCDAQGGWDWFVKNNLLPMDKTSDEDIQYFLLRSAEYNLDALKSTRNKLESFIKEYENE